VVTAPLMLWTDNCVPDEIGSYLAERGRRVQLTRDLFSQRAADSAIVQNANAARAIVVTFDHDYRAHAEAAMQPGRSKHRAWGLILLDYPKHARERHLLPWMDDIEREYSTTSARHPDTMLLHVEVRQRRFIIFR